MEEEGKELNEIIMHITVFFLHTNDVRWVIWLLFVHLQVLVEGEKAELEEVFDHDGNLMGTSLSYIYPLTADKMKFIAVYVLARPEGYLEH